MGRVIPRVKICGITRAEDADLAVRLGAHAIGFVFWARSPRVISRGHARRIANALPPFIARVGVFVDMTPDEVADVVHDVGLDVAQLHGDEDVREYERIGVRLMKAVSLIDDADVERVLALPGVVTPLVDATDDERRGGTGRRADWRLARRLADRRPLVLAGGLTAENVVQALDEVRPWAVDVSSGVEHSPGVKSLDRLQAFFAKIGTSREVQ